MPISSFENPIQHSTNPSHGHRDAHPVGRIAWRAAIAMVLLVGFVLVLQGIWIKGKTVLDDSLLNQAVQRSLVPDSVVIPDIVPRSPDLG